MHWMVSLARKNLCYWYCVFFQLQLVVNWFDIKFPFTFALYCRDELFCGQRARVLIYKPNLSTHLLHAFLLTIWQSKLNLSTTVSFYFNINLSFYLKLFIKILTVNSAHSVIPVCSDSPVLGFFMSDSICFSRIRII